MKAYLVGAALMLSSAASAQDFYCTDRDSEGGALKVDLSNQLLCRNGGATRADFCTDQYATALKIILQTEGHVTIGDQDYAFTEIVAKSTFVNSDIQTLRVYKNVIDHDASGTTTYNHYHADAMGKLWSNTVTLQPDAPLASGDFECIIPQQ